MKLRSTLRVVSVVMGFGAAVVLADEGLSLRIRQLELAGQPRQAREVLEEALRAKPGDVATLSAWAAFLDEHRDPAARAALEKTVATAGAASAEGRAALRRLVSLELLAGDRAAAEKHLRAWRAAGGPALTLVAGGAAPAGLSLGMVEIPGPLRSFARMAALSPELPPEEILLALARNIVTNGYQALAGPESMEQTEYLKLTVRYLGQARELDRFAGESKTVRLDNCDSTQTGELLKILGFRMRGGCGADVVLETVNATRAFLAMDSGFPLADLEQALRTNQPFVYDYHPTRVPVFYKPEYWLTSKEKQAGEFIDAFLNDPSLCRLYLGLAKLDPETAEEVRKSLPVARIRAFAHVFDFFGGMFRIRDGKASVPGGERAVGAWAELAGASPNEGVKFIERLVTRDDGWLASYFDSLLRNQGPTLDYLSEPGRLKRHYAALRGKVTSPGPARPVFRANTDLMLLTTRLRVENGRPRVPGGLEVWKRLFAEHPSGKYDAKLSKAAPGWKDTEDVLEALFGLSRKAVENEPLKIFLALSDIDRRRTKPLEPATVLELGERYRNYGAQYALFGESPALTDQTILRFLAVAAAVGEIKELPLRGDSAGMLQALCGLWQVMVRHGMIAPEGADAALAGVIEPFAKVKNTAELFDAGRSGALLLMKAGGADGKSNAHDRFMDMLAGAVAPQDEETHQTLLAEMARGYEAQKLVSLKVLFDLAEQLEAASKGGKPNVALMNRLATRVSDLNLPKATLSTQERTTLSYGYWTDRHVDFERRLNLRAQIAKVAALPDKTAELRGQLAPHLRDALVGLLYVHYAPPGAQVLYTNPLFVRSHDFIGLQSVGQNQTWRGTDIVGSGWPSNAGGRLVGSLANLPYALAEAEQNFLIPTREQALIWGDLVPQMLVSARLPRFWRVDPLQMHYVALAAELGETLLAESALSAELRGAALEVLDRVATPARVRKVSDALTAGDVPAALAQVTPAELYQMGALALGRQLDVGGSGQATLRALAAARPELCSPAAISEAFGTPKPTLANSHHPELLNLRTFPTLMGYSSRILAESWESNNLFFAALADELGLRPSQLNVLLPQWTQRTVEQIFATHLEDWPALLRSMRTVADTVRAETRKQQALENKASLDD